MKEQYTVVNEIKLYCDADNGFPNCIDTLQKKAQESKFSVAVVPAVAVSASKVC